MATKTLADAVKGVSKAARTVTGWVSTEALDRDGEILRAAGARLEQYRANPVVLFGHDHRLPIAKALDVRAVPGQGVEATARFASTAFASEVFDLFADGVLRAFSVGYRALTPFVEEALPTGRKARVLREWELLEYSAVAIPSNPAALAKAASGNRAAGVLFATYYPDETRALLADARRSTVPDARRFGEMLAQIGDLAAAVKRLERDYPRAVGQALARAARRAPQPAGAAHARR